jgi:type IV secretion system protein VirB10
MTDYVDPHASKISPEDPRLRLPTKRIRRLRRGPAFAALAVVMALIFVSVAVATTNTRRKTRGSNEDDLSKALRRPPLPPDLLKAPDYVPADPSPVQPSAAADGAAKAEPQASRSGLLQLPTAAPAASGARRTDRGAYSAEALEQKRIEEFWKARRAGVFVDMRDTERAQPSAPSAQHELAVAASAAGRELARAGLPSRAELGAEGADPTVDTLGVDPNLQGHKESFLQSRVRGDGYLHGRLQRPRSPYEIKAGWIIPAVLETGINSDLPGPVFARVREDVYDTVTGQHLLIPQNSTLVAAYDSRVAWGQERVLMCFRELILPNGNSLNLDCMPAADLAGAAGLTDEVDEHWWRLVKGAAISALLSSATTAAAGSTTGYQPTIPQQFARGAASDIGRAGDQITRRNLMVQPTITIRPGWSLNLMVTQTIDQLTPYPEQ